jgi:hypothetical protein
VARLEGQLSDVAIGAVPATVPVVPEPEPARIADDS